jgi:hypothetical protein
MSMNGNSNKLASALWSAKTPEDVKAILLSVGEYSVVSVGRDNNIGTIRMASDPALAIVERITNGMDSLLELAAMTNQDTDPRTPQEAARLLGVSRGGIQEMSETERRKVAEALVVSLHESGDKKRPTVRIEDHGMGQHPSDFARTLLSLNESNKVRKPYTTGTYGQGGSVTFGFSQFTIIVSRRHHNLLSKDQKDVVGWTVVYEEATDPSENILPRYVWVVRPDGTPFTLNCETLPELAFGTRITHIGYDLQGLLGPFTTQMWQFLHAALFEPVMPFLITGDRANDAKKADGTPDSRVVIGNAARLANIDKARGDIRLGAYDSHQLDLDPYGKVTVDWWALVRPEDSTSRGDPAASYVDANSAISLTLNGQRQDTERRSWIKDKAMMPFLFKNMVVHINCNGLLPLGRRELFTSTRERGTESDLRKLIYQRVAELIRTNEMLKGLNHGEKERLLSKSTATTNAKVRKRLSKFIKTKLADTKRLGGNTPGGGPGKRAGQAGTVGGGEALTTKTPSGSPLNGRNYDDTHLLSVPTQISFESKRMKIPQGRTAYVWVSINGKNGYLPDHDDALNVSTTEYDDMISMISRSKLLGGKTRWSFAASADAPLKSYVLRVELTTSNGLLSAELPVEIIAAPEERKASPGIEEDTGPKVVWVFKANNPDWEEQFGPKRVGNVTEDDDSTTIWVNRDYDALVKALASRGLSAEQIETRRDRYQLPVACGLWLQHHEIATAALRRGESPPTQEYQDGEMRRLAEAVLVAMDPDVDLAGIEAETGDN